MGNFGSPQSDPNPAGFGSPDPLQESVHDRILSALGDWVRSHPAPDEPALSVAHGGQYSPRALYEAVQEQTAAGQFFETILVNGIRRHPEGLEGLLKSFREEDPDRMTVGSY